MSAKPEKKAPGDKKRGAGEAAVKPKAKRGSKPNAAKGEKRLRPGELNGLVLAYMRKNEKDLPMTPGTIAKALGRSSGAVGNCLERLAKDGKARQAKKLPAPTTSQRGQSAVRQRLSKPRAQQAQVPREKSHRADVGAAQPMHPLRANPLRPGADSRQIAAHSTAEFRRAL
jgi:hypothetical protein